MMRMSSAAPKSKRKSPPRLREEIQTSSSNTYDYNLSSMAINSTNRKVYGPTSSSMMTSDMEPSEPAAKQKSPYERQDEIIVRSTRAIQPFEVQNKAPLQIRHSKGDTEQKRYTTTSNSRLDSKMLSRDFSQSRGYSRNPYLTDDSKTPRIKIDKNEYFEKLTEQYEKRIDILETANLKLQGEVEQLEAKNAVLDNENKRIEAKRQDLKQKIELYIRKQDQIDSSGTVELERLEIVNQGLQARLNEVEGARLAEEKALKAKIAQLRKELDESVLSDQDMNITFKQLNDTKCSKITGPRTKLSSMNFKFSETEEQTEQSDLVVDKDLLVNNSMFQTAKEQIKEVRLLNSHLKTENETLKKQIEDFGDTVTRGDVELLNAEIKRLNSEMRLDKVMIQSLKREIMEGNKFKSKVIDLEKELESYKEICEKTIQYSSELQNDTDKLGRLALELNTQRIEDVQKTRNLRIQLDLLNKTNSELDARNKGLESELLELVRKVEAYENQKEFKLMKSVASTDELKIKSPEPSSLRIGVPDSQQTPLYDSHSVETNSEVSFVKQRSLAARTKLSLQDDFKKLSINYAQLEKENEDLKEEIIQLNKAFIDLSVGKSKTEDSLAQACTKKDSEIKRLTEELGEVNKRCLKLREDLEAAGERMRAEIAKKVAELETREQIHQAEKKEILREGEAAQGLLRGDNERLAKEMCDFRRKRDEDDLNFKEKIKGLEDRVCELELKRLEQEELHSTNSHLIAEKSQKIAALEQEIEKLKIELQDSKTKILATEEGSKHLEAHLEQELAAQAEKQSVELTNLRKSLGEKIETCNHLNKLIRDLKEQIVDKDKELHNFELELTAINGDHQKLRNYETEVEAKNKELIDKLNQYSSKILTLERKLTDMQERLAGEIEARSNQAREMEAEAEKLEEKLRRETERHLKEFEIQEARMKALEVEKGTKEVELEMKVAELERVRSELRGKSLELGVLKRDSKVREEGFEARILDFEKNEVLLREEIDEVNRKWEGVNRQLESVKKENSELALMKELEMREESEKKCSELEREIEAKKRLFEGQLEQVQADCEARVSSVESELQKIEVERQNLARSLEASKKARNEIETDLASLKINASCLRKEKDALEREKQDIAENLNLAEIEIKELKSDLELLNQRANEKSEGYTELEDHLKDVSAQNESLSRELKKMTTELENCKKELSEAENNTECDDLRQRLLSKTNIMQEMRSRHSAEVEDLQTSIQDLKHKIEDLRLDYSELKEDYERQVELNDSNSSKEAEIGKLKTALKTKSQAVEDLKKTIRATERALQGMTKTSEDAKNEGKILRLTLEKTEERLQGSLKRVQELESEINKLEKVVEAKEGLIEALNTEKIELEEEHKKINFELRQRVKETKERSKQERIDEIRLQRDLEDSRNELKVLKESYEKMTKKAQKSEERIAELEDKIDRAKRRNDQHIDTKLILRNKIEKLKDEINNLKENSTPEPQITPPEPSPASNEPPSPPEPPLHATEIKAWTARLVMAISAYKRVISLHNTEKTALEEKSRVLRKQQSEVRLDRRALETSVKKHKTEVVNFTTRRDSQAKVLMQQNGALKQKIENLESEIVSLKLRLTKAKQAKMHSESLKTVEKELQRTKKSLKKLQKHNSTLKQKLRLVENEYSKLSKTALSGQINEQVLSEIERRLLKLDERVKSINNSKIEFFDECQKKLFMVMEKEKRVEETIKKMYDQKLQQGLRKGEGLSKEERMKAFRSGYDKSREENNKVQDQLQEALYEKAKLKDKVLKLKKKLGKSNSEISGLMIEIQELKAMYYNNKV